MADFKSYVFENANYVDLILYQFGCERCEPLHTFGPSVKNHYLFHYVLSGMGRLYPIDEAAGNSITHVVKEGEGFLITPNTINTYEADQKNPWSYIWVEFDGLKAKKYLDQIGLSAKSPIFRPKSYEPDNEMETHLTYLIQDFLIRYRLNKACEMMKNKDIKLQDVAAANGYPNQFYFSKMFKKVYHMTPREWRNQNL